MVYFIGMNDDKNLVNEKVIEEVKKEEKEQVEEISIEKENSKDDKQKKKKNAWKYFIYLLIVLVITVIVLWINLVQPVEGEEGTLVYEMIPYFIQNMNYGFLALFLGIVLFSFLLNAFMMFLYARLV